MLRETEGGKGTEKELRFEEVNAERKGKERGSHEGEGVKEAYGFYRQMPEKRIEGRIVVVSKL